MSKHCCLLRSVSDFHLFPIIETLDHFQTTWSQESEVESQRCLVRMFSFATQLNAQQPQVMNHNQHDVVQDRWAHDEIQFGTILVGTNNIIYWRRFKVFCLVPFAVNIFLNCCWLSVVGTGQSFINLNWHCLYRAAASSFATLVVRL